MSNGLPDGLASDELCSDGVNYYRRLAISKFQENISITVLKKITQMHIGVLIFLKPFFSFFHFP